MLNIRIPERGFFREGGHPRSPNIVPSGIVMHATADETLEQAINALIAEGLAYHYLIDHNGDIVKCIPLSWVGYHAGNSYGWIEQAEGVSRVQGASSRFVAGCSVNPYTFGVSFVNLNDGKEQITDSQIEAGAELIRELKLSFPALQYVTSHLDVSPRRKIDPLLLNLNAFADKCGLAAWHFPK